MWPTFEGVVYYLCKYQLGFATNVFLFQNVVIEKLEFENNKEESRPGLEISMR